MKTLDNLVLELQAKMDHLLAENARLKHDLQVEHERRLTAERSADIYHQSYNDLRAKECECQQRLMGMIGS
jgi:hypothetical protein